MNDTEWANVNLPLSRGMALLNIPRSRLALPEDETVFKKATNDTAKFEDFKTGIENLNAVARAQKICLEKGIDLKFREGLHPLFGYSNNTGFFKALSLHGWAVNRPIITSLNFAPNPSRPGYEIATATISKSMRAATPGMTFILRNIFDTLSGASDAHRLNGSHMLTSIDNTDLIITFDVLNITGQPFKSPGTNIKTHRINNGRVDKKAANGMLYAEIHQPTTQFAMLGGFDDRQQEATNTFTKGMALSLNLLGFADHFDPATSKYRAEYKPDNKMHFSSHFANFNMEGCSTSGGQSRGWRGALIVRAMFNQSGFGGVGKHTYCDRGLDAQVSTDLVVTRSLLGSFGKYALITGDSCRAFLHSTVIANSKIAVRGLSGSKTSIPASKILGNETAIYATKGAEAYVDQTTDIEDGTYAFQYNPGAKIFGTPTMKNIDQTSKLDNEEVIDGCWYTGKNI